MWKTSSSNVLSSSISVGCLKTAGRVDLKVEVGIEAVEEGIELAAGGGGGR